MNRLLPTLRRFGVDRAVGFTLVGRVWALLAGPVNLLLIARQLTSVEQGFYYTFNNVLGLQILFELGLTYVIFQFASHEKAVLHWNADGTLEGETKALERIFALLRKALWVYAGLACLIFLALVPGGLFFFQKFQGIHSQISWQMPWIWVVSATAADLITSPIVAVLEGGGQVSEVALIRAVQFVVGSLFTWAALVLRGGLLAAPMSNTVIFLGWWVWLLSTKRGFLRQMLSHISESVHFDWWREVWPFQWRIALSGISSYFIFLLATPIVFMFKGAVVAGQMGMTGAVVTAIATIAVSWASTKMSPFGTLIAQRKFKRLDELFFPSLWTSLGVLLLLGGLFFLVDYGLNLIHHPLAHRLLSPVPCALLLGTAVINHVVGVEAIYLRAHKQEPFLTLSVVVAFLTAISTYLLVKNYSLTAMLGGNFLITLVFSFGWGTWIFVKKRELWHEEQTLVPVNA